MQQHVFPIRVYYEDTDLAGIVYYANYLKFIERARTEWLRSLDVDQTALKTDHGVVFAVRHVTADYIKPARFDEALDVVTKLKDRVSRSPRPYAGCLPGRCGFIQVERDACGTFKYRAAGSVAGGISPY